MLCIDPDHIVADFPAVTYIKARPTACYKTGTYIVQVHDADVFACDMGRGTHENFTLGSAVGFALRHAECPVESVKESLERGHEIYWAFKNCVSLTSHQEEKKRIALLELGQIVKMEGKRFMLVETGNSNIGLVEQK